jgi:hypothetical protein
MKMLRFYRVDGSSLSVRFNADGSVCTAILTVGERQRNAAPQLPGLNERNAVGYLAEAGYALTYEKVCLEIGKNLNDVLANTNLLVETVGRHPDGFVLSVIDRRAANYVCPIRLFAGVYNRKTDRFVAMQTNENDAVRLFTDVLFAS